MQFTLQHLENLCRNSNVDESIEHGIQSLAVAAEEEPVDGKMGGAQPSSVVTTNIDG